MASVSSAISIAETQVAECVEISKATKVGFLRPKARLSQDAAILQDIHQFGFCSGDVFDPMACSPKNCRNYWRAIIATQKTSFLEGCTRCYQCREREVLCAACKQCHLPDGWRACVLNVDLFHAVHTSGHDRASSPSEKNDVDMINIHRKWRKCQESLEGCLPHQLSKCEFRSFGEDAAEDIWSKYLIAKPVEATVKYQIAHCTQQLMRYTPSTVTLYESGFSVPRGESIPRTIFKKVHRRALSKEEKQGCKGQVITRTGSSTSTPAPTLPSKYSGAGHQLGRFSV